MNYLINVDSLEFRVISKINLNNLLTGSIYKLCNGLFLEKVKDYGYLKQEYPHCFKMKYKDDDIGLLYTKTLDLSLSTGFNTLVVVDNKVLYVSNLAEVLKMIVEALEMTETRIKRLDICYDTDDNVMSKFKTLYYDTSTKFFKKTFKVQGTGKDDELLFVGSLKGKKCIAIYNKTLEINSSHKEYIRTIHRNFFGYKNIYRLELRLKSGTSEFKNMDIMRLDDTNYLETIFNTYFDDMILFKDKKTKEKIEFITLNNTGIKLQKSIIKQKAKTTGGKQVKTIIGFMDNECKKLKIVGVSQAWKLIRSALLKKYRLEVWYNMKMSVK